MNIDTAKKEALLFIKYIKTDLKEEAEDNFKTAEAIETLSNELDKKDGIIKNQSYTNQKLRKKLQGYRKLLKLKEKHLVKKDKVIDLMAEHIDFEYGCKDEFYENDKEEVKEYFYRKVEG